jgi:hypothetical protein
MASLLQDGCFGIRSFSRRFLRISLPPREVLGLLCSCLILIAGCGDPSPASLEFLSVSAMPATVSVGSAATLRALVHFGNGTTQDVTSSTQWTLSNSSLATLSNGVLTSKAPGTLTVQGAYIYVVSAGAATPTAQAENLNSSAQITITGATPASGTSTPSITWNTPAAIQYGMALSNVQLDATASVPGTFTYTPAAGTVLQAGSQMLTATFTPSDTSTYSAATSTVQLAVAQAAPIVTWAPLSTIQQGTALSAAQLNATANVPGTFLYSPAAGTVLPVGTQQLTATFIPSNVIDYSPATAHDSVTITAQAVSAPTISWNTPAPILYGTPLSTVQLNAMANVPGTFTYTPAAGTVLQAGSQLLTAIFTPSDTTTYSSATSTVQLAVKQATPVIIWAALSAIQQGTALSAVQLDATANVAGTFSYSPAAGTVLPTGTQQLAATFTPSNPTDYASATAQNTVTVTAASKSAPNITWNTPAPIQYGTALSNVQLNATANVPGTFTYTPAAGTVPQAGSQKLTATFTPSDTTTYSVATSTVQLAVTQATPVITWAVPSAIQQGTALSSVQLDATANVVGTFSYIPAAGTVLPAGSQQLTVTFTPSNTTGYASGTAHNSVTVTPASTAPSITWSTPAPIQYGTALSNVQLNATANVPGTFTYAPPAGTVPPAGSQKLTATFTPSDTTTYSVATSAVQLTVTQVTPVITWPPLAAIQQGTALSPAQLDATANVLGRFSYSPAAGTVLPTGTQLLTVTFTPSNTTDYTSAMASNSLTVSAGSPTGTSVNGSCGPANGTTASVAPTAGLCSTGTASVVAGTGPWTWMCTGSDGGTSSSCMASPPVPEGISAFLQSFGINTELSYPGTPYYGEPQSVISALQYLGINTIRDQPPGYTEDPTTLSTDDTVAAAGVQFDVLIVGNGPVDIAGNLAAITAFEQAYPGVIAAIEGPNEINAWPITYEGITNTYSAGAQVTQGLWTAVQANASLKSVPVYALTLSNGITGIQSAETELGNLATYVTYGNAHIYAGSSNNVWQYDMPYWLPIFEQDTPGKPMVITETGYATVPSNVDEISAAKYNLNTFFENALNGIVKTYLFQLVDLNSSTTDTDPTDHSGQFYDDWTPKTGATAIHNLTTILQSAGSGTAASMLSYSVSGLPATGHTLLLGSSTAFDIAVWIDATIYDPTSDTDIAAPAYSTTINLGAVFASVAVYDPMVGTAPIATYSNASTLQINVTDHPLIVQVD